MHFVLRLAVSRIDPDMTPTKISDNISNQDIGYEGDRLASCTDSRGFGPKVDEVQVSKMWYAYSS